MLFSQAATEHREVLSKQRDSAAINSAGARNYAIAKWALLIEPKIRRAMSAEGIIFFERPLVEQQINTFASRQLAFSMLSFDTLFTATQLGLGAHLM